MLHNANMKRAKQGRLAELLREKRNELNMTQGEMAKKVGVSPATISLYESGDRKPELGRIKRLASIIGISEAAMLDIEIPDADLDLALRAENLTTEDMKHVRQYIKTIKYARKLQQEAKPKKG